MAPRRHKQTKLGQFPVVSPRKGIQQVREYAAAIQNLPKRAGRQLSEEHSVISRLHARTPSDLAPNELDLLHQRLGYVAPMIIPESPPISPPMSPVEAVEPLKRTQTRKNNSQIADEHHIFDSEGEYLPCIHCT